MRLFEPNLFILFQEYARSNVPGIALYMTGLNQARGFMAVSPLFAAVRKRDSERHSSVLPVLSSSGNLLAGASTRVAVGLVLNPFSVLKARYEVSTFFSHYRLRF